MSTKAIEDALGMAFAYAVDGTDAELRQRARVAAARAELEAIRKAAKTLDRLNVGDFTYDVRNSESVMAETPEGQSTWEHPDVKAWSDASGLMGVIAKEDGC